MRLAEVTLRTEFDVADIVDNGLAGVNEAADKRAFLGTELGIGWANAKTFLQRLNRYGVSRAEFDQALAKWEALHE